jgi:hypothetical protein
MDCKPVRKKIAAKQFELEPWDCRRSASWRMAIEQPSLYALNDPNKNI